jgi:tRNA threonylcarbamoyladenosine biosynthesis protein TsaB
LTILAIDTTTDIASVAIRRNGVTLSEEVMVTADGQSHVIYAMVRASLDKAGVGLSEIDCFASAVGPGSFTGVRICLAAAKGLADAMGKPVAGISNLRALASFGTAALRNPIIDARRGQIYSAVYSSQLEVVSDEIVTAADSWRVEAGVEQIVSKEPLAAAIALCAEMDGPGKWMDAALLDANYVRRADGDSMWVDSGGR